MSYFDHERLKLLQLVPAQNRAETKLEISVKNRILIHTRSILVFEKKNRVIPKMTENIM